jgi:heptosyltransferase-2
MAEREKGGRKIAVLQLGRLGDMILTTPLFEALGRMEPSCELTVIAAAESAIIAETHPAVSRTIAVPRGFLQLPTLARKLRPLLFDLYIDPKEGRSTTSRYVGELVHATEIVMSAANHAPGPRLKPLPPADPPGHYVDRMLSPMKVLAPGVTFRRRPSVHIPSDAYRAIDPQLIPGINGILAINISAGASIRHWLPAKWEALINALSQTFSIALLSSPRDRPLADEICAMRKEARPVRTETILEAAAVVSHSRAVISLDTSIIHLASELDKPTVGLYPPSAENAITFAPLATRHRVLMPAAGGSVAEIEVAEVLGAVYDVLGMRGVATV